MRGLIYLMGALSALILFQSAYGQGEAPFELVQTPSKELKILLTIFGLDGLTSDIMMFVEGGNQTTRSSLLDPSLLDAEDNSSDGIAEYGLTHYNSSLAAGDLYRVCILLTEPVDLICKSDLKSPSDRRELVKMDVSR